MSLVDDEHLKRMQEFSEKHGDGRLRPTAPNGRMRYCVNCERLASDIQRNRPDWVAPLAHSWSERGQVYWTDLCKRCLDFEKAKREAAKKAQQQAEEVRTQAPQIGMPRRRQQPTYGFGGPRKGVDE